MSQSLCRHDNLIKLLQYFGVYSPVPKKLYSFVVILNIRTAWQTLAPFVINVICIVQRGHLFVEDRIT